jgi:hypothetical protein
MIIDRDKLNELRANLSEADGEFIGVQGDLTEDVSNCFHLIMRHDKECWRRAYVRAVFAFIEGGAFSFKQVIFRDAELKNIKLSSAEKAFLVEETYQLNEQGDVSTKAHYGIRTAPNLRFLWKMAKRIYGKKF